MNGWHLCYLRAACVHSGTPVLRFVVGSQAWLCNPADINPEEKRGNEEDLLCMGPVTQYAHVVPLPDLNKVAEACLGTIMKLTIHDARTILDCIELVVSEGFGQPRGTPRVVAELFACYGKELK